MILYILSYKNLLPIIACFDTPKLSKCSSLKKNDSKINLFLGMKTYLDEVYFFYNFRGIIAMLVTFLAVGVTQTPDGPLKRPHPG